MAYIVKKIASKRWDVLKDAAPLITGFPLLGLANTTAAKIMNEVAIEVAKALESVKPPLIEPPSATPPVDPPVGPPVPPVARTVADKILGPTLPVGTINALGPTEAAYVVAFQKWWATHWRDYGDGSLPAPSYPGDWARVNYYDRVNAGYAWFAMTGDATYRDQARAIAKHYIHNVTNGFADYNVPPYDQQLKGVALYYLDTGDPAALTFIDNVADVMAMMWVPIAGMAPAKGFDSRSAARTLECMMIAALCGAPSDGYAGVHAPGGNDFAALARTVLERILASQSADGCWRYAQELNMAKPFMDGMVCDALILYFSAIEPDPRIPVAVQKCAEGLWSKFWRAGQKSFVYLEGSTNSETGPFLYGAPDLNGLIINAYSFAYAQTGDAIWKDRAQLILEGLLGAYFGGQKQFNQSFTLSYKTFAMLSAPGAP